MITYNELCEQHTLPLLPMRGIIAFPGIPVSVEVGRSFSKNAIDMAQKLGSLVFLVAQRDQNEEDKILGNVESIGVIAQIKQVITGSDGNLKVVFEGICRAEVSSVSHISGYYAANITSKILEIDGYPQEKEEALLRRIRAGIKSIVSMFPLPSKDFATKAMLIDDLAFLCDFTASNLLVKLEDKQDVLNKFNKYERAELLIKILAREARIIKIEAGIQRKTKERIDESQREYYLREQLKVIQAELGNDSQSESEELYELRSQSP
jgi:ATP-dependent Lon protease